MLNLNFVNKAPTLAKDNENIKLFLQECNSLSTDQASLEKLEKKGVKTTIEIKHPFKWCFKIKNR